MKRNSLTTAVLAGLTGVAGMVGVSNAVNLNPDGLGQVLLYPYYTARGGNDTLISIVNTTDNAKSVKVRFLEGLNSREVLDFNLYMSAFDVWAAGITGNGAGGATLLIPDSSCTVPYFFGNDTPPTEAARVGSVDFVNYGFTGPENDEGPQGIERVASGYIEVIEMGTLVDRERISATYATHVPTDFGADGTFPRPLDCGSLVEAWTQSQNPAVDNYWLDDNAIDHDPPSGGLFGGASIINVDEGVMFSYNAEAIDAFSTAVLHRPPGDINPDLSAGNDTSNVFINGVVDTQTWPSGVEAVSATILFDTIMNEYVVNPQIGARSEWVVNFPTKRFYVDQPFAIGEVPVAPFTVPWSADFACEPVDFTFWDREEAPVEIQDIPPIISPPPPDGGEDPVFRLCFETNVLRFGGDDGALESEILKEPRFTTFNVENAGFISGWVRFQFNSDNPAIPEHATRPTAAGVQYLGLPAIGFWANTFSNGFTVGGTVQSNYGGTFRHRGSRRLQLVEPQ